MVLTQKVNVVEAIFHRERKLILLEPNINIIVNRASNPQPITVYHISLLQTASQWQLWTLLHLYPYLLLIFTHELLPSLNLQLKPWLLLIQLKDNLRLYSFVKSKVPYWKFYSFYWHQLLNKREGYLFGKFVWVKGWED